MFTSILRRSGTSRSRVVVAFTCIAALVTLAPAGPARAEGGGVRPAAPVDPAGGGAAKVDRRLLDGAGEQPALVFLKDEADLAPARAAGTKAARGQAAYGALTGHAERRQARVRRLLDARRVPHRPLWIANAVAVRAEPGVLAEVARLPEVESVVPDNEARIIEPVDDGEPAPAAVTDPAAPEWNVAKVKADQVWARFGVRGEDIVVANIDTGVQFDHPALAASYRGRNPDGTLTHDYNWYDPTGTCEPVTVPCDNVFHGTHVMGTMVGDGGPYNHVGVAPGARWIAAKGCPGTFCRISALLAAAQWMLAPTDPAGRNPRPELAPHVVNNSYTSAGLDVYVNRVLRAWRAAGIFGVWAAGNFGPRRFETRFCGMLGIPAIHPEAYAVGAMTNEDRVAWFSSRGPGLGLTVVKPDIAAPGQDVRSSVPGGGYAMFSGTSMASPHVAGAVALLWSVVPALARDIDATIQLLDRTAIDSDDPYHTYPCGGTPQDNNAIGEGRLDALALVQAGAATAPAEPGSLRGNVRAGGGPADRATVRVTGPVTRTVLTDPAGDYGLVRLPAGTYTVTAARFGSKPVTTTVEILAGAASLARFRLPHAPARTLRGTVRDADGRPVPGTALTAGFGPHSVQATAGADGKYRLRVPAGRYDLSAEAPGCFAPARVAVDVDGDTRFDPVLPPRTALGGYTCRTSAANDYVDGGAPLAMTGRVVKEIDLPFPVTFQGRTHRRAVVSADGTLGFGNVPYLESNVDIPDMARSPYPAVHAFWDELFVGAGGEIRTAVAGQAPHRRFVVEWHNVSFADDLGRHVTFEVLLYEDGRIATAYRDVGGDPRRAGASATVGLVGPGGQSAFRYSYTQPVLASGTAITWRLPGHGLLRGSIVDGADGRAPNHSAKLLTLKLSGNLFEVGEQLAEADGTWQALLPVGRYAVQGRAPGYAPADAETDLPGEHEVVDVAPLRLSSARVTVSAPGDGLKVVVPAGARRTRTLALTNSGGVATGVRLREGGGATGGSAVRSSWTVDGDPTAIAVQGDGALWLRVGETSRRYRRDGTPDGTLPAAEGTRGLTYVPGRGELCSTYESPEQYLIRPDRGLVCFDPASGAARDRLIRQDEWTATWGLSIIPQGVTYRPEDDTFFVTQSWIGLNVFQVAGFGHMQPGAILSRCVLPGGARQMAWSAAHGLLWFVAGPGFVAMDPRTCGIVASVPFTPGSGSYVVAFDVDAEGLLWAVLARSAEAPARVARVDTGLRGYGDVPWLSVSTAGAVLEPGASLPAQVTVDATGLAPGTYDATVSVESDDPRQPVRRLPVRVVVSGYQAAFNTGGGEYTDSAGDVWAGDREYVPGGAGHVGGGLPATLPGPIAGTPDAPMYVDQREGLTGYRFDGVPHGVYRVELRFAELRPRGPGDRLFDVSIEGREVLPALDVADTAGPRAALDYSFEVTVTDGRLDIDLTGYEGYDPPILNAVRVTHRPDLSPATGSAV